MGERGETEQAGPLGLLLDVQQRDLLMDQLTYRRRELEERKALDAIDSRIAELDRRGGEVRAQLDELTERQREIESHVVTYTDRIATIERRLREGGAYREVQAMSAETESLDRHRRELEDRELEVMEELEPVEKEVKELDGDLAFLATKREEAVTALAGAEALVDAEIATARRERAEMAAGLPADLAATYERLRAHLGGIGAARLVDGACSGCHLQLPSSERERVLHSRPGEVVFCDQCGRILVP